MQRMIAARLGGVLNKIAARGNGRHASRDRFQATRRAIGIQSMATLSM
jgi:hypothetical protein